MDLNGYNAEDHEPADDFSPLPKGWYPVVIIDSEERETRAGDGSYLNLTLEVIDGQYKGRKLWANLNLNNPNETAVEIAQRQLSAICRAVGVFKPKHSEELHEKPLEARVTIKQYQGEDKNEVKAFRALQGSTPAAQEKPAPRPAASDKPVWKR